MTANPGSDEAIKAGCKCPVIDNGHGRTPPYSPSPECPEGAWWIDVNCPLHGKSDWKDASRAR